MARNVSDKTETFLTDGSSKYTKLFCQLRILAIQWVTTWGSSRSIWSEKGRASKTQIVEKDLAVTWGLWKEPFLGFNHIVSVTTARRRKQWWCQLSVSALFIAINLSSKVARRYAAVEVFQLRKLWFSDAKNLLLSCSYAAEFLWTLSSVISVFVLHFSQSLYILTGGTCKPYTLRLLTCSSQPWKFPFSRLLCTLVGKQAEATIIYPCHMSCLKRQAKED